MEEEIRRDLPQGVRFYVLGIGSQRSSYFDSLLAGG